MTQSAKAQEPSMEEILASIRRIISDEEPKAAAASPKPAAVRPITPSRPVVAPSPAPHAAESRDRTQETEFRPMPLPSAASTGAEEDERGPLNEDILELTEQMATPSAPAFRTIDGSQDIVFAEADPHPPVYEPSPAPEPRPSVAHEPPAEPRPGMMQEPAPMAEAPVEHALMSEPTVAAVDSAFNTLAHTVLVQNGRTLEDLVREMLRPMLKSWLDDNLPGLVERLVRAEIERVSRGRS